jgi:hypothetical protein
MSRAFIVNVICCPRKSGKIGCLWRATGTVTDFTESSTPDVLRTTTQRNGYTMAVMLNIKDLDKSYVELLDPNSNELPVVFTIAAVGI